MFRRLIASFVCFTFIVSTCPLVFAQEFRIRDLPVPGTMVSTSPAFEPALIKGLTVHKDNPFLFDFIVDPGQDSSVIAGPSSGVIARTLSEAKGTKQSLKDQADRMIKYFFAALTIPDKDIWVNLSPYEKDRMVPVSLGQTAMGRDLLAQDYLLKQLTASLIYPQKALGKTFWNEVYSKAKAMYGTTQIPVNTFNKVWIVPQRAGIYEHNQTAFIVNGHLKVMLEEDYEALNKNIESAESRGLSENFDDRGITTKSLRKSLVTAGKDQVTRDGFKSSAIGSQVLREIVIPALETEINEGKNFATLRQIFYAQVLAVWFKRNLKQALLNRVYANKGTVKGIDQNDAATNEAIYRQYLRAYKKGVFNFIKEDIDPMTQETLPRKYFSGGYDSAQLVIDHAQLPPADMASISIRDVDFSVLAATPPDAAALANPKPNAAMISADSLLQEWNNARNEVEEQEILRKAKNLPIHEQLKFLTELMKSPANVDVVYALNEIRALLRDHLQEVRKTRAEIERYASGSNAIHGLFENTLLFMDMQSEELKGATDVLKEIVKKITDKENIDLPIVEASNSHISSINRTPEAFQSTMGRLGLQSDYTNTASLIFSIFVEEIAWQKDQRQWHHIILYELSSSEFIQRLQDFLKILNPDAAMVSDKIRNAIRLLASPDKNNSDYAKSLENLGDPDFYKNDDGSYRIDDLDAAGDALNIGYYFYPKDHIEALNHTIKRLYKAGIMMERRPHGDGGTRYFARIIPEEVRSMAERIRLELDKIEKRSQQQLVTILETWPSLYIKRYVSDRYSTGVWRDDSLFVGFQDQGVHSQITLALIQAIKGYRQDLNLDSDSTRSIVNGKYSILLGVRVGTGSSFGEIAEYDKRRILEHVAEIFERAKKLIIEGDAAMTGREQSTTALKDKAQTNLGGIDLSQQDAALHVEKDANGGVKVNVDPALIARVEREGMPEVVPVIINMRPADIRSLFGTLN